MDNDNYESLSAKVIEMIAEAEGVAPTELQFSLYNHIDPGLLDQLDSQTQADWELAFEVQGYLVQTTSDGTVTVEEASDECGQTIV